MDKDNFGGPKTLWNAARFRNMVRMFICLHYILSWIGIRKYSTVIVKNQLHLWGSTTFFFKGQLFLASFSLLSWIPVILCHHLIPLLWIRIRSSSHIESFLNWLHSHGHHFNGCTAVSLWLSLVISTVDFLDFFHSALLADLRLFCYLSTIWPATFQWFCYIPGGVAE